MFIDFRYLLYGSVIFFVLISSPFKVLANQTEQLTEWLRNYEMEITQMLCNGAGFRVRRNTGVMIGSWCRYPFLGRTVYSRVLFAGQDLFTIYTCEVDEDLGRRYKLEYIESIHVNQEIWEPLLETASTIIDVQYRGNDAFPIVYTGTMDSQTTGPSSWLWSFEAIMPEECKR